MPSLTVITTTHVIKTTNRVEMPAIPKLTLRVSFGTIGNQAEQRKSPVYCTARPTEVFKVVKELPKVSSCNPSQGSL